MTVLHLTTSDIRGGAARAAYRLHDAIRLQGVKSAMLVRDKYSADPDVSGRATWLEHTISEKLAIADGLPVFFSSAPRNTLFSPALLSDRPARIAAKRKPDLIHLHWVTGGFLRIESLARLTAPIVWTLHDMWPFTGGCHYSAACTGYTERCGGCPLLRSDAEADVSRKIWQRKAEAWKRIPLTLVAPSRWLARCAANSSLFADRDIRVIPNPIDTQVFKRADESKDQVRRALGLSTDHQLILFGAMDATSDSRKGFPFLHTALQSLARSGWGERAEVVIFGAEQPHNPPDFGMQTTYVGSLHDDQLLARLVYAADVFVAPSQQDNLPNTVMEALACATPVVAFHIGGMPDMIEHGRNGWLATPFNADELAQGIAFVLSDCERYASLSEYARLKVERTYAKEIVASSYISLYQELL